MGTGDMAQAIIEYIKDKYNYCYNRQLIVNRDEDIYTCEMYLNKDYRPLIIQGQFNSDEDFLNFIYKEMDSRRLYTVSFSNLEKQLDHIYGEDVNHTQYYPVRNKIICDVIPNANLNSISSATYIPGSSLGLPDSETPVTPVVVLTALIEEDSITVGADEDQIITFTGFSGTAPYTFSYFIDNSSILTINSVDDSAELVLNTLTPGVHTCTLVSVKDSLGRFNFSNDTQIITIEELQINFGLLYNWFAVTDERNIAASGWHVATADANLGWGIGAFDSDIGRLIKYLDPSIGEASSSILAAQKMMDDDTYWDYSNGNNLSKFNARGSGRRGVSSSDGSYNNLKAVSDMWVITDLFQDAIYNTYVQIYGPTPSILYPLYYGGSTLEKWKGLAVRLVKDSTTLSHGETGVYVGNDGKRYRTICIGTQEWLADNLAETKYRNGDAIPEVTDNASWTTLTTAALCAYNNDWNNV